MFVLRIELGMSCRHVQQPQLNLFADSAFRLHIFESNCPKHSTLPPGNPPDKAADSLRGSFGCLPERNPSLLPMLRKSLTWSVSVAHHHKIWCSHPTNSIHQVHSPVGGVCIEIHQLD
jgi:hypothetical protein